MLLFLFCHERKHEETSLRRILHLKVSEQQVTARKFYISEKNYKNATDSIAASCNGISHHEVSGFESTVLKSLLKSQSENT